MSIYYAFYSVNLLLGSSLQVTLVSKTSLLPPLTLLWGPFFRGCEICTGSGFYKMFHGFLKKCLILSSVIFFCLESSGISFGVNK